MPTLLRIDSSARHAASHSRRLGDVFETEWLGRHPDTRVVRRDLASNPLPHIVDATIVGFYTPIDRMDDALRAATTLSDTLIAELKSADVLLITAPMYNFSVPSGLKAWVDQIVRIGHTFACDGSSFTGLVTGRQAVVALAYGASGYGEGGPLVAFDMLRSYLQLLLGFLGFTDVRFVGTEATTAAEITVAAGTTRAHAAVRAVAEAR